VNPPLVSVIMPVFNRRELLEETLGSLVAQTYAQWELVAVDDGSTDGSPDYLQSVALRDPRIRFFVREGNPSGACACRNQAFRHSRGELILFLDSDDLLPPECLTQRVTRMENAPSLDAAVFACRFFATDPRDSQPDEGQSAFGNPILDFLKSPSPWLITSPLWRRTALERLGPFREDLAALQDWEFHLRALRGGLAFVRWPDEAPFLCRRGNASISTQNRRPAYLLAYVDAAMAFADADTLRAFPPGARPLLRNRLLFGMARLALRGQLADSLARADRLAELHFWPRPVAGGWKLLLRAARGAGILLGRKDCQPERQG
jgi:glycosyltransferase involved in cell wall biosynthesis